MHASSSGLAHIRGLGLIELLVALFVAGLLTCLGFPTYRDWIDSLETMNEAQHLASSMNLARSEAIKRGQRVNLCKSADGRQCSSVAAWNGGWIMHSDGDANGQVAIGETPIRALEPLPPGIVITPNRPLADYVSYTAYGHARMLNGALQIGTFTVCKRGQRAIDVVLSAGGRARITKTGSVCP